RRHGSGRPAAGTSRCVVCVPWISRWARIEEHENRRDALSKNNRSGMTELLHHRGVVCWHEVGEGGAPHRRSQISRVIHVLHAHRKAVNGTAELLLPSF